jgi:hypothetical protein
VNDRVAQRRAIEAFRAGIPSRDAVRELPPRQHDVEEAFHGLLQRVTEPSSPGRTPTRLILRGSYGTGKSHWLESFRHIALERGYVVSTVSVGKEGPLFDLGKLYGACLETASAQGVTGPALEEIAPVQFNDEAPYYEEFINWLQNSPGIDPRFALTVRLYTDRKWDEDLREGIVREWAGCPMAIPYLRKAVKGAGMMKANVASYAKVGVERARFAFLTQLFRSVGHRGWIVLLDEGETMARYTTLQRLKSYANLSWMLGAESEGIGTVLAMAPDWVPQVLNEGRNDLEGMPAKFMNSRHASLLNEAVPMMRQLASEGVTILDHSVHDLRAVHDGLRALYTGAYDDWPAPDVFGRREYNKMIAVRQYIRNWIYLWDFERLYQEQVSVTTREAIFDNSEDSGLEKSEPEDREQQA